MVASTKDSEQTKQMEGLQQRNGDLAEEKERLVEEIEQQRMASVHGMIAKSFEHYKLTSMDR